MKRWFWHADLQLRLGQAMLESLWIHVALRMLASLGAPDVRIDFVVLASLPLAAAFAARASERLPFRVGLNRALLAPAIAALIAGWVQWIVGGSPIHWTLAVYLAARGLLIGLQRAGAHTGRWFVLGAVTLVVLSAVIARVALPVSREQLDLLRALMLGYFVSGIALLSAVHRVSTHRLAHEPRTFSASWLVAIAVPIAAVSCAALALASTTSILRTLLELAYYVTDQVGYWTLQILTLLGSSLGALLRWLGQLFGSAADGGGPVRGGTSPPVPLQPGCQPQAQHALGATSGDPAPYFLLAALAIGVIWFLRQVLQARAPREVAAPADDEESVSLWSWALFRRQLADFWAGVIASFGRTALQLIERIAGAAASDPEHAPIHDMRSLYRALLRWAARHGHRRPSAATPLEFADQLEHSLGHADGIRFITAQYIEERYGDAATTPDDLARAVSALDQLQRPKQ